MKLIKDFKRNYYRIHQKMDKIWHHRGVIKYLQKWFRYQELADMVAILENDIPYQSFLLGVCHIY